MFLFLFCFLNLICILFLLLGLWCVGGRGQYQAIDQSIQQISSINSANEIAQAQQEAAVLAEILQVGLPNESGKAIK